MVKLLTCAFGLFSCTGVGHAADQAKPRKVKDGETAVITTTLSPADATAKVKAYFNGKDIDFTVNLDTGRIISDWYGERRCGIGFNRCANRANVRVIGENGTTVRRVQVFERKREGGISEKPWNENSTSRGRETGELADILETYLNGGSLLSM
jgi:hypothetical protein